MKLVEKRVICMESKVKVCWFYYKDGELRFILICFGFSGKLKKYFLYYIGNIFKKWNLRNII